MTVTEWPTVDQAVTHMKIELLKELQLNTFQADWINFFYDLHDYLDANMLCEDILPALPPEAEDEVWNEYFEKAHAILVAAQDRVNAWIIAGGLK